jgi:glycosyltransferase involved in cell wall biosynthesis/UDP:flavonoid glycosyltransferase YjiC (YdhE family)
MEAVPLPAPNKDDAAEAAPAGARLRVLNVILSRGFAGSERAAIEACAALAGRHDVALVVRSDHRDRMGVSLLDQLQPGIEVFQVPPRWRTEQRLAEIVDRWRPDIIHTHLRRGTRYISRVQRGARHVSTVHLHLNGPHYLRTDALFCISEWQLATVPPNYAGLVQLVPNSLVPHPKLAPERIREIRAELGAGDDDFLIGAVGRLVPRKGFDVLLHAFAAAKLERARLVVVGEGSERRSLERLAGDNVTFTGFRRDVKDLYQAFDLFVCPSRYEPFGRVIAEALDAGVPVVASDAQGPRDIATRYPVELVATEDPSQLVAALQRQYAAGRRRIACDLSEFSLEATAERMERAYRQVLARPPVAARVASGLSPAPQGIAPASGAAPVRILFSPVSGPGGAGELMRCLIIARELAKADPAADIRFLVNRHAVFRESVNFPIIDCEASPTNSTAQVLATIDAFRPDVMVFDNSGRTSQLRAARRVGARLVFSSRAPKLRWKAFRLKWMRLLDEHWIVFPTFVTGGLSRLERFKLRFFPHYGVRQFDTLFTPSEPEARNAWLQANGLAPGAFVVFIPGGRGEATRVAEPAELFIAAAREFAASTGYRTVVLTGRKSIESSNDPNLLVLPRVEPDQVQYLLAEALFVVSNGGSTMIHVLAHGRPIIAVPLAGDQDRRIRRAVRLQIADTAERTPHAIAATAAALLQDPAQRAAMCRRTAELGIANGVDEAVAALLALAHRGS